MGSCSVKTTKVSKLKKKSEAKSQFQLISNSSKEIPTQRSQKELKELKIPKELKELKIKDLEPKSKIEHSPEKKIHSGLFISHKTENIDTDYLLGKNIGQGGLGSVKIASHRPTKQERAIKQIKKLSISSDMIQNSQFFTELDILKSISHPNIVKLFEFYEDQHSYYLVMEYLKGGDLFSYILKEKPLTEKKAAYFFKQLLSAVSYCHSLGIVHRDLKPDHLLLDNDSKTPVLKIIDFGTSAIFDSKKRLTRKYGSTHYIAPEVLYRNYSEKCDVWSCGVILYVLLAGFAPFEGDSEHIILSKIIKGKFSFEDPVWEKISNEAKDFIAKMIRVNEKYRISAADALGDIWLLKNCEAQYVSSLGFTPIFNNLKQFHAREKLQTAILTYIASQMLSKDDTKELNEMFRAADTDCDGKLSKNEMINLYSKRMPRSQAASEVEAIMNYVDTDGSGFIDYTEFLVASMKKEKILSKKNLENAFRIFDKDGSGNISMRELKEFLRSDTVEIKDIWNQYMNENDQDGDGEINVGEFKDLISRIFQ